MENTKQVIGLLNTTLRGIRLVTGNDCGKDSAEHIMRGIYLSINSFKVSSEFVKYCLEQYSIKINN